MKDMEKLWAAPRPSKQLNPMERAAKNPGSRQMAIEAKCCDCVGGPDNPGWRREIRECPITKCPLYQFRPYQQSEGINPSDESLMGENTEVIEE